MTEACGQRPTSLSILSRLNETSDRHVGALLRRLRLNEDMSQEALGEQSGVSHQQLQKYETGANRTSASRLFLIAKVLGIGPADLSRGRVPNWTQNHKTKTDDSLRLLPSMMSGRAMKLALVAVAKPLQHVNGGYALPN